MSDSQGSRGGHAPVVFGVPTSARGTVPASRNADDARDGPMASAEEHGRPARSTQSGSNGATASPEPGALPEGAAFREVRSAEPARPASLDGKPASSMPPVAGDTAILGPVSAAASGSAPAGDSSWFELRASRATAAGPTTAEAPQADGDGRPVAATSVPPGSDLPSRVSLERTGTSVRDGHRQADIESSAQAPRGAAPSASPPALTPAPAHGGERSAVLGDPASGSRLTGTPQAGPATGSGAAHPPPSGPGQPGSATPGTSAYAAPGTPTYPAAPAPAPSSQRPPASLRPVATERPSLDTAPSSTARAPATARRARLRLSHVDPKAVLRISFIFSLCVFVVVIVAFAVLWMVLSQLGVFDSVINAAQTLTDKADGGIRDWLTFQRVMEIALVVGAVNVVLMTLLSTLGALLYNLCADLVGGVEVTLTER